MEYEENQVYSKEVIEFVTVSNEFCNFLETAKDVKLKEFITISHKLLALLYFKATTLPRFEANFEEANEKFVTEDDYNYIHNIVSKKFGQYDSYEEVFDPVRQESEEPVSASLAEDFADMYQDIKDFLMLYRVSPVDIMNDAVWECQQNFERYWGQKLVNALRALHTLCYNTEITEPEEQTKNSENPDCQVDLSNWAISKKQQEYRDEESE